MAKGYLELHLLRHADAGDPGRSTGSDAERPLSGKGRRQAERLGALLAGAGLSPDLILTSPKLRAVQTATIVGQAVDVDVREDARLGGPLTISTVAGILADAGSPDRPMLVGHDPDFSDLASELVGMAVALRKCALVRIDVEGPIAPGAGVLRWLVPPEILGR
jgi:phosphohistidine phosphatase